LGARGDRELDKVDIRLGAIYALEQIARDSPDLHWPIVEILTAFIREHTNPAWKLGTEAEAVERL
jgi:hypothetical protein